MSHGLLLDGELCMGLELRDNVKLSKNVIGGDLFIQDEPHPVFPPVQEQILEPGNLSLDIEIGKTVELSKSVKGETGVMYIVNTGEDQHLHYKGTYEVTPQVQAQTLETKNLIMDDDLTIKKIPYYMTTNLSNGYTVYIGSEI